MAVAGTLAVNIIARTQKFTQGVKKAREGLGAFVKNVRQSSAVTSTFNTLLAGVSAGGLVRMGLASIETAAELGNVADKLGIATQNLELMRFAAEQTDVSTQTLDMALQRMVRRVGQAAQGTGEASQTLKDLGINAEELNKLDPAAQFERISAAVQNIPDRGGQLAAMQKIFDSEGVGLINLAAEGVERYVDAFERAGGATQGVKAAQAFALSLNELQGSMTSLTRNVATNLVPTLQEAIAGAQVVLESLGLIRNARQRRADSGGRGFLQTYGTVLGELLGALRSPRFTGFGNQFLTPSGQTTTGFLGFEALLQETQRQTQLMEQQDTSAGVTLQPATFE